MTDMPWTTGDWSYDYLVGWFFCFCGQNKHEGVLINIVISCQQPVLVPWESMRFFVRLSVCLVAVLVVASQWLMLCFLDVCVGVCVYFYGILTSINKVNEA